MSIVLYHAVGSCAFAALISLEQAGAEYELRLLDLARGDQRDPRYLAINPHGRVPALEVRGEAVTETIAVLTYLAAAYPKARLLPTEPLLLGKAMQRMSWIASTVHVALAQVKRPGRFVAGPSGVAELAEGGHAAFASALAELDAAAPEASGWLTGDTFSAVDMYALVVRRWADGLGVDMAVCPRFDAYCDRIKAQPATQRAYHRERETEKFFDMASGEAGDA